MAYSKTTLLELSIDDIDNHLTEIGFDTTVSEIIAGLTANAKYIQSKYFYDKIGSALFEKITSLNEYYPSRTEKAIISQLPPELIEDLVDIDIIELGCGDHSKISLLMRRIPAETVPGLRYFPIDISRTALEQSIEDLRDLFPALKVKGILADYVHQMHLFPEERKRLFCFFGSTIGNLSREETLDFMQNMGAIMNTGDMLFVGMDRVKNIALLEKAYNDDQLITAMFNKNILRVINGLIKSDFNPDNFEHRAFYNTAFNRIEMHLEATDNISVKSAFIPELIRIKKGETIHTENSHKFEKADILRMGQHAGLAIKNIYSDENELFSLAHYQKK